VEKHVLRIKKDQPALFSWEIREKLVDQQLCTRTNAPSVSSINRLLRSRGVKDATTSQSGGGRTDRESSPTVYNMLSSPASDATTTTCETSPVDHQPPTVLTLPTPAPPKAAAFSISSILGVNENVTTNNNSGTSQLIYIFTPKHSTRITLCFRPHLLTSTVAQ
jgi:hypothetical protein